MISTTAAFSIEVRVFASLANRATWTHSRGLAWPRVARLAAEVGADQRLVFRALAALEARGLISSVRLEVGDKTPLGETVRINPMRVFRILPNARTPRKSTVIDRSGGPVIDRSGGPLIDRSAPPYDPDHRETSYNDDDSLPRLPARTRPGNTGPEGGSPPSPADPPIPPRSEKDDARGSRALGAEGAAVISRSSHPGEGDRELADAPTSGVLAVAARAELGGTSDETDFEEAGATSSAPAVRGDPGRFARRVIEAWRDELALDHPPRGLFTRERRELVAARLREGFTVDELAAFFAWARRNEWFREHAGRRSIKFLLEDRERLLGWLEDARRAGVSRRVSRPPVPGTTSGRTPPTENASTGRMSSAGPQSGADSQDQPQDPAAAAAAAAAAAQAAPFWGQTKTRTT